MPRSDRNPKFEWEQKFNSIKGMKSSVKVVGLAIGHKWNGDTQPAMASVEYLMKATGLSESTVKRALRELRSRGWIAQARRGGRHGDVKVPSTWRMTIPQGVIGDTPKVSQVTPQGVSSDPHVDPSIDPEGRPPLPPPRSATRGHARSGDLNDEHDNPFHCGECIAGQHQEAWL